MGLKNRGEGEDTLGVGSADGSASVERFRRRLLAEVNLEALARLDATQLRARLERITGDMLSREGPVISQHDRAVLIRQIVDEMLGLGVLEPLLADEAVTEIMVNGPGDVWVERHGRLQRERSLAFASEDQLYQTIDRIVAGVNRRVDESSPMVDARLPSGERVNVIIPPLSLSGPVITIRRFPTPYSMGQLVRMGSLDQTLAELLRTLVEARLNMVISGGTGTGKTTFLNALSGFVPPEDRIVTIEDSAELQLQQPHVISLESRPPNVEGVGEVTIRDLVRNSLRMRPDRIIVGEVRGGETLDMIQAMNTGHEGSLATVHANSSVDAVMRLETLASMTDLSISFEALRDQINGAVHAMIHLQRAHDGSRRVAEVSIVVSEHREPFRLLPIARFDQDPVVPGEPASGTYDHRGLPPALHHRLRLLGLEVPDAYRRELDPRVRSAVGA